MKLEENREIWLRRVEDFKASKLSQVAWSRENSVSVSSLRYWLRKLKEPESSILKSPEPALFASVLITEDKSDFPLVIEVSNIKISLANNYDETLLLKLIKTLKKL